MLHHMRRICSRSAAICFEKGNNMLRGGCMVRGTPSLAASLAVVLFGCAQFAGQPSPQRVACGAAEPAGQMVNRLAGWLALWLAG